MEAAMSSSLGAMGPLLRKLDGLLVPECCSEAKLFKNEIELLKKDLEEMTTAFVELSEVETSNLTEKYWVGEVRELSYDIDDCIEKMTPVLYSKKAHTKGGSVHRQKVGRVKIDRLPRTLKWWSISIAKIAQLRTLVREASERHKRYLKPDSCRSSTASTFVFTAKRPVPALYGEAANLVGIDDSTIELTKWLKNETEKQLKVVSIVGPGGIGKTTLAKHLYRELGGQFDCRAFVQASRKPNMRRLLAGILAQVQRDQRPTYACSVQNLIDNLSEHLQPKRYFIVIDDLWQTTAWDIVNSAFPEGNNCSTIITTTEIEDVALECCGYLSGYIFKMEPLGMVDCEKIFFNKVFGSDYQYNKELAEISYGITTKCGGLPLATISIASLLASQPDKLELRFRAQKCLWSTLRTNPTFEGMLREILNLCYNSLPHYLKTCLMYFSMYPEGYTILKANLVKQWIAEGFITELQGKDKEEVAESYFDELVNRGMIQPNRIKYVDGVLSCTVHHMVLDIIKYNSKEENFITTLDYPRIITGLTTKVRRLSLQLSSANHATKWTSITTPQVRSLAFFGLLECMPSVVRFKLLRVLILELWGDHDGHTSFDLTGICRLFQLRYLKITCDVGVELPPRVKALRYLETLEVDARVIVIPSDIVHLPVLSHLRVGGETDLPDGIGQMTSLRTLQCFNISDNSEDNVRSLGELTNLQDLHVTCSTAPSDEHLKRNLIALASSLGKLGNLKSVSLDPGASATGISFVGSSSASSPPIFLQRLELLLPICIFSRFPKWIGLLCKLCILKVAVRELLTNDIDNIAGLPALTVLSLYVQTAPEGRIIFNEGAFPVLKYFKFRCGVLCLAFMAGAAPNLRRLKLCFNTHIREKYDRMLAGIEHLLNIQDIAGRIGVATGADESDRRAAESAFKDAISKHPGRPRFNVQWVDSVDEEYRPVEKQHWRQEKGSSDEQHGVLVKGSAEDSNKHDDSGLDETEITECPVGSGVDNSSVELLTVRPIAPLQPSGEASQWSNASPAPLSVSGKDNPNHQQLGKESHKTQFGTGKATKFHDAESILPKSDISDRPSTDMDPGKTLQFLSSLPKKLPSQFLREITDGFSDERKVGEGAFGVVYKGRLQGGEEIAVKRFREQSALHDKQFQNEVGCLMEVKHENVVKLIGYCYEIQLKVVVERNGKYILTDEVEKLLCCEYIPKGSLDKHLFDEPCELDWHIRFKIIKGICEGLRFLHEGSQRPIIHLDLKPCNILLDDNMVPKIADFGLSRLFGPEQTRASTQDVIGSIGYMAPEYLYRGEISAQSDIYSLGLLIIEIATGEKNCPNREDITAKNFIENVRQNWTNMSRISSKYPSLDKDCLHQVKRCIEVGLNCVETNPRERPSIREIFNRIG